MARTVANRSSTKARFQGGGISDEPTEPLRPGDSISSPTFKAGIIGTVQAMAISQPFTRADERCLLAPEQSHETASRPVPNVVQNEMPD